MRTYQEITDNLSLILNHSGRSKNGQNAQEDFLRCIRELKQNFQVEISTKFLFGLMDSLTTDAQKKKKIRNLILGVNTKKENKYSHLLEVIKQNIEIKDFSYTAKAEFITKKAHRGRITQTPKMTTNAFNQVVFDYREQDELRDNGFFLNESAYINLDCHNEQVGRELNKNHKEILTFITA